MTYLVLAVITFLVLFSACRYQAYLDSDSDLFAELYICIGMAVLWPVSLVELILHEDKEI